MLSNVFVGRSDDDPTAASGEGGMTTAVPSPTSIAPKMGVIAPRESARAVMSDVPSTWPKKRQRG